MPGRKTNKRDKSGRKLRWDWIFYFVILLVIIVAIVLLWPTITSWTTDTAGNIRDLFGWGLVFIAIAVVTLAWLVWRRRLLSLFRRWYRWLGVIVLATAAWGIISLRDLGGNIGWNIIGYPEYAYYVGALRILGLLVLSVILISPGAFFRVLAGFISWLWKRPKRQVAPRPTPREKTTAHPVTASPRLPEVEPEVQPATPAPVHALAPTQKTLRQVAQEVWKKYGESPSTVVIDGWRLPPIDILDKSTEIEFSQADNVERARIIEEALASYGVESKVVQINAGPTVTQFGVEPGWDRKMKEVRERDKDGSVKVKKEEVSKMRVKVERITSLANDLALALASPSIRIEAPVPGQSVVGIEVPNVVSSVVSLRGVIETSTFQKMVTRSKLSLALGKGAGGEAGVADLGKMPHLLIAGATGSGKTVCLNSIICCLLLHNIPDDIRLILIDPKRVELTLFNSIPHLAAPVIVNNDKALEVLRWLIRQMDERYQQLARAGARNIENYNKNKQGKEKMPYLILVIDELADVMLAGFDEVEHILCRLAQLARATGIHLIVATQRPSVDVVTGLIKANFPTRISFAVTSQVDSRTILDGGGAEKLLGKGDMLYMPTEAAKPKRLQGCFVSDAETERLVYFWASQKQEEVTPLKIEEHLQSRTTFGRRDSTRDPLLEAAIQLAQEHEHISTSFLQRRLQIGYPRAARIKEQLDEELAGEDETQDEESS